jgi:hypothetical protein
MTLISPRKFSWKLRSWQAPTRKLRAELTIDQIKYVCSCTIDRQYNGHIRLFFENEYRGCDANQTSGKEDVAEFLTEVLAAGPVEVLKVERQARLAGLLGDTKRLRETKSFKAARKDLGVLSTRDGFGQGARYVLSLPGIPCAPQKPMGAHSREGAHMENPDAHDGIEGVVPTASPDSTEANRLQ